MGTAPNALHDQLVEAKEKCDAATTEVITVVSGESNDDDIDDTQSDSDSDSRKAIRTRRDKEVAPKETAKATEVKPKKKTKLNERKLTGMEPKVSVSRRRDRSRATERS